MRVHLFRPKCLRVLAIFDTAIYRLLVRILVTVSVAMLLWMTVLQHAIRPKPLAKVTLSHDEHASVHDHQDSIEHVDFSGLFDASGSFVIVQPESEASTEIAATPVTVISQRAKYRRSRITGLFASSRESDRTITQPDAPKSVISNSTRLIQPLPDSPVSTSVTEDSAPMLESTSLDVAFDGTELENVAFDDVLLDGTQRRDTSEFLPAFVADFSLMMSSEPNPATALIDEASTLAWLEQINAPLLRYEETNRLGLFDALVQTIKFSPEIEILRAEFGIRQQEIEREKGAFNWNKFVETNWREDNNPVGSTLDGAIDRSVQRNVQTSLGLEKPNIYGGQMRLSQEIGYSDSNSQFFVPNDQAIAGIALQYEQPLLRGAGQFVNTGLIQVAGVNARIGQEQLIQAVQRQLSEVASAYWELVRLRGALVVQQQNFSRTNKIADVVVNRQSLDIGPVQLARVDAAMSARRTEVLQAEYAAVQAQDRFLRLIYGSRFTEFANKEVLPECNFFGDVPTLDMEYEIQQALKSRPEVVQTIQEIRRSSIERGIAENQLLPILGLTLSVSNRGLQGDRRYGEAFRDQWDLSDPSYAFGLSYSFPITNQAARASLRQAQLRIVQFQKLFEQTIADVSFEVRSAVRNVALAANARNLTVDNMTLTKREFLALEQRAALLIDGDQFGPLYLEDLIQTQQRVAVAELEYLIATTGYFNSHFELQRANGTLMRSESFTP